MKGFETPRCLTWLQQYEEGRGWLARLPQSVAACAERWQLTLGPPFENSYVSIVFPATRADGSPAVLKIQYPHTESEHEGEALRRWNGDGAVRLLDEDAGHHALLLERCEPGDHLSSIASEAALDVLVALLPRLWVDAGAPFRSLGAEAAAWSKTLPGQWERAAKPFAIELLDTALDALDRLSATQSESVLLHQDLHGDNVLRAAREPWLVIDPKPLVGERALSLAPIIRSREFGHSARQVVGRLDQLTEALGVDRERARLWALAQTLAWGFDESGGVDAQHLETARWLWKA